MRDDFTSHKLRLLTVVDPGLRWLGKTPLTTRSTLNNRKPSILRSFTAKDVSETAKDEKPGLPYCKHPRRLGSGDDSSPSHLKADDSSALHKSYRRSALISSSSLSAICYTSACVGGSLTVSPSVATTLLLLLVVVVAMASLSCWSVTSPGGPCGPSAPGGP